MADSGSKTVSGVVGLTQAAATTAIAGAGLVVGTVTTAPSDTVPLGNVAVIGVMWQSLGRVENRLSVG
jgi:beta-lactam-binding protein with PASTA domain